MHGFVPLSLILLLSSAYAAQNKDSPLPKSLSKKRTGLGYTVVPETKDEKGDRIVFLERFLEVRKNEIKELEEKLFKVQTENKIEISEWEEKLTKMQAENVELKSQLQAHKDENSEQKSKHQYALLSIGEHLNKELAESTKMKTENAELKSKLQAQEETIRKEKLEYQSELQTVMDSRKTERTEFSKMETENAGLKSKLEAREETIRKDSEEKLKLHSELEENKNRVISLLGNINELRMEASENTIEVKELKKQIDELSSSIKCKDEEIADLRKINEFINQEND